MKLKEMFDEFYKILGWIGAILILLAYFMLSMDYMQADSIAYQAANAVGGMLLVCASLKTKDFPLVALNAVWFLIAVIALVKLI